QITLSHSPSNPTLNSTVTYNVTLTGGPTPPSGTVVVNDGVTTVCTPVLTINVADTTGSCNVPYNAADAQHSGGPHTMRAVFTPGTGTWTAATSAADIVNVAGAPTTISIPASTAGNTYNYATPTTL